MDIKTETVVTTESGTSFIIEMEPSNYEETGFIHAIRESIKRHGSDQLRAAMQKNGGGNIAIKFNLAEGRYDAQ